MLLHYHHTIKSSKFDWLEQGYWKYYYSRFPLYDSDACISGTPPQSGATSNLPLFHQAVCECLNGNDHGALTAASSSCTTAKPEEVVMSTCCSFCHQNRRNITAKQLQMTKSKWPFLNFSKSNTVAPKAVDIQNCSARKLLLQPSNNGLVKKHVNYLFEIQIAS